MDAKIIAVARDVRHRFSKPVRKSIRLIEGLGVKGDAHAGRAVQHLSRIAAAPAAPNLRQVHLIHAELFDELAGRGFDVGPGQLGENVTTRGIDLLALSCGTRLLLGSKAVIEITGLRNPCRQMNGFAPGLMQAVLGKSTEGSLVRKAGVMAVVVAGGEVCVGDPVAADWSPQTKLVLEPV